MWCQKEQYLAGLCGVSSFLGAPPISTTSSAAKGTPEASRAAALPMDTGLYSVPNGLHSTSNPAAASLPPISSAKQLPTTAIRSLYEMDTGAGSSVTGVWSFMEAKIHIFYVSLSDKPMIMTLRNYFLAACALLALSCGRTLKDGDYTLTVLSTNDVHGTWFDSTYVDARTRPALTAVKYYVDSVRTANGAENVLLLDAGDCLQGDNAPYYFNYVDTETPHLFPRLMAYMGYDAVIVGNHDIETGHAVYDRVAADLKKNGVDFLAANAIRNDNGKPYFTPYKIVKRAGLKVAILGYTNANMKAWLTEELWSGMHFVPIVDVVQADVDAIRAKENPDVLIVVMHSGTGAGDGKQLESEGLDVFQMVQGVDFVLASHDHRPYVDDDEDNAFLNSGSHSRNLAEGKLHVTVKNHKIVSKTYDSGLIPVKATKADADMKAVFYPDYQAVKAFTLQEIGILNTDLWTRDAYRGMCDYLNLIHTLSLGSKPAEISFAAPLTFNGHVNAGIVKYNDLFTIYPFENQLFVVKMTGEEIRNYLEHSYDKWINTIAKPDGSSRSNPRTIPAPSSSAGPS